MFYFSHVQHKPYRHHKQHRLRNRVYCQMTDESSIKANGHEKSFISMLSLIVNFVFWLAADCVDPHVPEHAFIANGNSGKYIHGDRVYYGCKRGYYLSGIPMVQCRRKSWSKIRFHCNGIVWNKVTFILFYFVPLRMV